MSTQQVNKRETVLRDTDEKAAPSSECACLDIYLGAFLHALGYRIEYCRSTSYQSEFYFKEVPASIILKYYNDAEVTGLTARKLFSSFQEVRRLSRQVRLIPPVNVAQEQQQEVDKDIEDTPSL